MSDAALTLPQFCDYLRECGIEFSSRIYRSSLGHEVLLVDVYDPQHRPEVIVHATENGLYAKAVIGAEWHGNRPNVRVAITLERID